MRKIRKVNQRGDTLIEVLIAITVMGIVVVGVMAMMNRTLVSMRNSAERTAVRAEINSQTELLHYLHATNHDGGWDKIRRLAHDNVNHARTSCRITTSTSADDSQGSFFIDSSDLNNIIVQDRLGYTMIYAGGGNIPRGVNLSGRATVGMESDRTTTGIWIDAVFHPISGTNPRPYFDFYIKACWTPLGGRVNSESVTIVRIYDTR